MTNPNPLDKILTPEFDYIILKDALKGYRYPRNKIRSLLKSKQIIRVKKGFYVKKGAPYDRFILANMLYGPSYVSEDSALSYYGLIPERVEAVISTTDVRRREYSTPLGEFIYNTSSQSVFSIGVRRELVDENRAFLIASPEKALFDRLSRVKGLRRPDIMHDYLLRDMRFDETAGTSLNLKNLEKIGKYSAKPFVNILIQVLREWRLA